VSFAISPSSTPANPSSPLSSPTGAGEASGGFAALFDSVAATAPGGRPSHTPPREATQINDPASNNQATPERSAVPVAGPQAESAGAPADTSAPPAAAPTEPVTPASHPTATPTATVLPTDVTPALAPVQKVTAAVSSEAPAVGEPTVAPLVAPMAQAGQTTVASTPGAQPLRWQLLGGGMRVLTAPETPDADSLAAFAQRQGLTSGQWRWLNGLAATSRTPGNQLGPQGVSPGTFAASPEAAALHPMAGSSPAPASAQAQAAAMVLGASAPAVELLVLEADPAVLAELGLGEEGRGEAAARPVTPAPASPALSTAVASPAATYAAQWYRQGEAYQALARQLGEAMASRLQQQIGRGQWQLQLTLRPASLGRVDVDLAMRQGELEATFQASQASTRELLVDSFPRLREALQQSGTQVASLDVQGESRGESDRKPTPQPLAAGPASSDDSSPANMAGPLRSATLDDDAVDVWA
jgi:flagellar hook-length control protein FliK